MKFRVWDNKYGSYIADCDVNYIYLTVHGYIVTEVYDRTQDKYVIQRADEDRYTVEQYTGFTDKNGREIYEGDRVERKHESGVVQFVNGQWVIMRGGVLLGSVAYQTDDFEVTGTVHDVLPI